MFYRSEIVEEFLDTTEMPHHFEPEAHNLQLTIPRGYDLHVPSFNKKLERLADKFLDGDEVTRAEIRKIPTPKIPLEERAPRLKDFNDATRPQPYSRILTWDDAVDIRRAAAKGATGRGLAEKYGVCHITVQRVLAGKTFARPREDRFNPDRHRQYYQNNRERCLAMQRARDAKKRAANAQ